MSSSARLLVDPPVIPGPKPAHAGGPVAPRASSAQPFDLEQDLARMEDDGSPAAAARSPRLTSLPALGREPGLVRRAADVTGELLMVIGVAWGLGVAVLAIGAPVALVARLLLWMRGGI